MYQIIEQDLQLDRVPQPPPGAAKHPIHKVPPQLAESSFNALAQLTEYEFVLRGTVLGNQQHLGLFRQAMGAVRTAIPQIAQGDATVDSLHQRQRWVAIIGVARRQDDIEHPSMNLAQEVELEAKEPPFAGFSKIRPLVSQQPRSPVSDRGAERNGLTIDQIQSRRARRVATGGGQYPPHLGPQMVQPCHPLLICWQVRKGAPPISCYQAIGLLQCGDRKHPLEQSNRHHFGVAELGLGMGRATPASQRWVGFQEFIDKAVDLDHVVVYATMHRSSSSGKNQRSRFDSTPPSWIDDLAVSTQD